MSLREVLDRTGLTGFFDAIVISAELGASKPSPRPFAAALEALGADAASALHVGDTYAEDVLGARAAGVTPVLVARDGAPPPDDARLLVVGDLRGVPALAT